MSMIPENTRLTRALEFAFEPDETAHTLIGPYKLLEKIGEGGFGVVWMAEQQEPVRRRVALKIVKAGMDTRELIARFEAERQALAMMDHPNIARVFDAGATETGRPYFVMELVRGTPITQFCDENRIPTEARLRLFIDVCQAVQHAHQKGIIHRDLKPSNILITLHDDKPVPKVIDFGIAKALGGAPLTDKTLFTRFHTFIGTPAYTSPEQIGMSGLDIDTRSDIYALGVLLYVLLTGETPFDAQALASSSFEEIRETIRTVEPPRPSQRVRARTVGGALSPDSTPAPNNRGIKPLPQFPATAEQLRGDLDWVVMRCLEKDRARRYESAAALAADVQRHLAHEPVVARPPSAAYTLQKLVRRHRVAFVSAAAIAAALVIGAVVSTWQAYRASSAEREATAAKLTAQRGENEQSRLRAVESDLRTRAEADALAARRRAYAADMNLVQQSLANDNLGRARELLYRHHPRPGESDLRGWEWRYLWQSCQSDAQSVLKEADDKGFLSVATSADGKWAALGSRGGGQLLICNLQTREQIHVPAGRDGGVHATFSPRDPLVAIATVDPIYRDPLRGARAAASPPTHRVLLWDLNTRQVRRELSIVGSCSGLAFAEDGETLVIGSGVAAPGATGEISVWRTADGSKAAGWAAGHTANGPGTAWFAATRDASAAATVTAPNRIGVIDLKSGRERWSIVATDDRIACLAFSPDGRVLASGAGSLDPAISLWDAETGQPLGRLVGQRGATSGLEFLADGKQLVSSSWDQTLRLWDLETRTTVRTFRGHKTEVHALALARDQRTLISGCKDGSAYVWDLNAERNVSSSGSLGAGKKAWGFAGDGESIVTLDANGRLVRRHGRTFQGETTLAELGPMPGFERRELRVLLDPKRPLLAVMTRAAKLQAWDWERRTLLREWDRPAGIGVMTPIRFSADGTKLVVIFDGAGGSSCRELEVDTGRETRLFNFPDRSVSTGQRAPVVSPDGSQLVVIAPNVGESTWVNLTSGRSTTHRLKVSDVGIGTRFSPDGRFLAVASMIGYARIFDAATYQEMATLSGLMVGVHSAAYSPDMRRLAIGSTGEEAVTLWDAHTFERLLNLGSRAGAVAPVAFSPDGNVIAGQSYGGATDGTIHFWRAPSWAEIEAAEKRAGDAAK